MLRQNVDAIGCFVFTGCALYCLYGYRQILPVLRQREANLAQNLLRFWIPNSMLAAIAIMGFYALCFAVMALSGGSALLFALTNHVRLTCGSAFMLAFLVSCVQYKHASRKSSDYTKEKE